MKFALSLLVGAAAAKCGKSSYLTWTADSFIEHGVKKDFHYTQATLYLGYEAAYELTKNESYVEWYRNQIDGAVVLEDGTIKDWDYEFYSLDDYRIGNNFLWWYERTGEEKYRKAADIIREQMNRHPRNKAGGFWHRKPVYPNQMWLDGIFMADTFYAKWTKMFDNDNTTAWDDILNQFVLIDSHTRNTTSGLLAHGYDESKTAVWADPVTGSAPLVWDRAVGWYFISLLEVIQLFPESHEGHSILTKFYTDLAAALKRTQDKSGGWWLIMSEPYPGMEGNYIESSASAMFTYGWLKGIKLGLIPEEEYYGPAKKGYNLLTSRFVRADDKGLLNWEGTVLVGSLNSNATFEYYIGVPLQTNDYKGVGPFMLASYEWETY
ncbi:hypothetical protein DL766_005002 [Monosporascus sp. MC13-8B]|uniref:Glycosyl hydrolase family 88 n=1 Tax=Monosporascus cannonballus TaxID=155416 RepID=A0ABY0H8R0_9PEZI|nr:hypothetical protein DL762_004121 [Monosporascus cannonballus]RYP30174.1 hypothetical protein DL766_005002 [Monosporascus sp. MC13-8B]